MLAALNHQNIAAIYGLEADGPNAAPRALVMELVEGPTLAERIAEGPIPLSDALPLAAQIAQALEAAHDLGVVHRDLKPANIKLRPDGTIKVLDFGLAKIADPVVEASSPNAATYSPTVSLAATKAGMILGTAAYMAPEQARGRPVDKRADVWAFGAVLYEMLTGGQQRRAPDQRHLQLVRRAATTRSNSSTLIAAYPKLWIIRSPDHEITRSRASPSS